MLISIFLNFIFLEGGPTTILLNIGEQTNYPFLSKINKKVIVVLFFLFDN